jgi:hypothetical protein
MHSGRNLEFLVVLMVAFGCKRSESRKFGGQKVNSEQRRRDTPHRDIGSLEGADWWRSVVKSNETLLALTLANHVSASKPYEIIESYSINKTLTFFFSLKRKGADQNVVEHRTVKGALVDKQLLLKGTETDWLRSNFVTTKTINAKSDSRQSFAYLDFNREILGACRGTNCFLCYQEGHKSFQTPFRA